MTKFTVFLIKIMFLFSLICIHANAQVYSLEDRRAQQKYSKFIGTYSGLNPWNEEIIASVLIQNNKLIIYTFRTNSAIVYAEEFDLAPDAAVSEKLINSPRTGFGPNTHVLIKNIREQNKFGTIITETGSRFKKRYVRVLVFQGNGFRLLWNQTAYKKQFLYWGDWKYLTKGGTFLPNTFNWDMSFVKMDDKPTSYEELREMANQNPDGYAIKNDSRIKSKDLGRFQELIDEGVLIPIGNKPGTIAEQEANVIYGRIPFINQCARLFLK